MQQVKVRDKVISYIMILWYHYFVLILNVIYIGHITSYLACNVIPVLRNSIQVLGSIFIGHITSYLACNVCPIIHIYSSSVNDWCITYFLVYNLIFFHVSSSFCLGHVVSKYKLNPNSIRVYAPPFSLQ